MAWSQEEYARRGDESRRQEGGTRGTLPAHADLASTQLFLQPEIRKTYLGLWDASKGRNRICTDLTAISTTSEDLIAASRLPGAEHQAMGRQSQVVSLRALKLALDVSMSRCLDFLFWDDIDDPARSANSFSGSKRETKPTWWSGYIGLDSRELGLKSTRSTQVRWHLHPERNIARLKQSGHRRRLASGMEELRCKVYATQHANRTNSGRYRGFSDSYALWNQPIVDLPVVGKNLADHPLLLIQWKANSSETLDPIFRGGEALDAALKQYHANGTGRFAANGVSNHMCTFFDHESDLIADEGDA
ncbi:hypothetical protein EDD85DRAFT_956392 [Armillaria nabsnona]|nr:hypothetical protein EDD85DRAFT_956392 [Armillaria nabsnona]